MNTTSANLYVTNLAYNATAYFDAESKSIAIYNEKYDLRCVLNESYDGHIRLLLLGWDGKHLHLTTPGHLSSPTKAVFALNNAYYAAAKRSRDARSAGKNDEIPKIVVDPLNNGTIDASVLLKPQFRRANERQPRSTTIFRAIEPDKIKIAKRKLGEALIVFKMYEYINACS